MPKHADEPLRKVTLNLYEEDCVYLEHSIGWGWSEYVRTWVHKQVQRMKDELNDR